ncbi:MAG: Gfo/Idh/MocA family oxidoreductase [Candidatus Eremiobacteraeota bacterium]|nr:Gfo/Idh/MocA family oxidoreductase [Candidatus Eremiobacteraeota bacterium]
MRSGKELEAAVVGLGYWGPNLLRNLAGSPRWKIGWIVDVNPDRLARMQRLYPSCRASTRLDDPLADPSVDLVAVATPPATHLQMALSAIRAGKHVLVEKPLAESSEDARALTLTAADAKVKLFTDHTFLYTGAVETMQKMHASGELGEIYYAESSRVNLGLFQQSNVIWDLAPHDFSILNYVFGSLPEAISCNAMSCINPGVWDVAFLLIRYDEGRTAQIHLSWLSPVKVRRMMLSASRHMIVWDDVDPSEKLRIYDKGVVLNPTSETFAEQMVSYRLGDVRIPIVDGREALSKLLDDVAAGIADGTTSRIAGPLGWNIVRCIEAAMESVRCEGKWVSLTASAVS